MSSWLPWRTWRRRATSKSAGRLKLGILIDFDLTSSFLEEKNHDIPVRSQERPLGFLGEHGRDRTLPSQLGG